MILIYYFVGVFCISYCGCFLVVPLLYRMNALDIPNQRSSHDRPVLRGGGLSIIFAVFAGAVWLRANDPSAILTVILTSAFAIAVISLIDDLKSVSAAARFGVQSAAAGAVLWSLKGHGQIGAAEIPLLLCALFVVVGYTNAFNFMDGINGIAAGQAIVTGVGSAVCCGLLTGTWVSPASILSIIVAGAAAGFLPHNFPRPRLFMGDVGSAPLGMLLAAIGVWMVVGAGAFMIPWLLALHSNFILDTGFTLGRRIVRGEKWYAAHREHFYQRLVRSGLSHTLVTSLEMALQLGILLICIIALKFGWSWILVLSIAVTVWTIFYSAAEWRFRSFNAGASPRL